MKRLETIVQRSREKSLAFYFISLQIVFWLGIFYSQYLLQFELDSPRWGKWNILYLYFNITASDAVMRRSISVAFLAQYSPLANDSWSYDKQLFSLTISEKTINIFRLWFCFTCPWKGVSETNVRNIVKCCIYATVTWLRQQFRICFSNVYILQSI